MTSLLSKFYVCLEFSPKYVEENLTRIHVQNDCSTLILRCYKVGNVGSMGIKNGIIVFYNFALIHSIKARVSIIILLEYQIYLFLHSYIISDNNRLGFKITNILASSLDDWYVCLQFYWNILLILC